MPPQGIAQVLRHLPPINDPNLLVGTETHDDAGVYRLTDEIALVQTIDFFPPVVNDAFVYGQIAAANSLSDVYAMGGRPLTALNLVGYPDDKDPGMQWLADILKGGAERCQAAGCVIVGGHTVRDAEIKFGYAVTGLVHPQKIFTNANAKPGDKLVLTKALGTGFATTAHKAGACSDELLQAAVASMIQLNDIGRDAMIEFGAHAGTDVTGFGLAGHSFEMAHGSNTTIVIELARLPLLPGAEAFARKPYLTRASATNAGYVAVDLEKQGKLDPARLEFFYDAQTSGGILMSLPADKAEQAVAFCKERGASATAIIGDVIERRDKALVAKE
ncbi:MAG: selenide, water dikinase SelD [Gemmataceae bacterium]|nr:selenide, water dikinase SelD [Gemmataceae bacterium]